MCVCWGNLVPGGSVLNLQWQLLHLSPRQNPPRMCYPVASGSTTPPVTREMLSEGGSNGFHVAWIPWLVVTSQPGPSSHQTFIVGMHLEQSVGWDAHIVAITKLGEQVAITKLGERVAITKLGERVAITKLGEQVAGNTKLEWWSFVYLLS